MNDLVYVVMVWRFDNPAGTPKWLYRFDSGVPMTRTALELRLLSVQKDPLPGPAPLMLLVGTRALDAAALAQKLVEGKPLGLQDGIEEVIDFDFSSKGLN